MSAQAGASCGEQPHGGEVDEGMRGVARAEARRWQGMGPLLSRRARAGRARGAILTPFGVPRPCHGRRVLFGTRSVEA